MKGRGSRPRYSVIKMLLKISQNAQGLPESVFNKVVGPHPETLSKADSGLGVVLWTWQNFSEQVF